MPMVFGRVYQDGYNLSKEECNNSTILFVEAFKSALNKSVGLYHPLQDISDNMIFTEDVDGIIVTDNDELVLNKDNEIDITGLQPMCDIESDDSDENRRTT